MYLLGLRALGHDVLYIEDTGECIYDPAQNARSLDPGYGTRYIHDALAPFGFGERWCFVNYDGSHHGNEGPDDHGDDENEGPDDHGDQGNEGPDDHGHDDD